MEAPQFVLGPGRFGGEFPQTFNFLLIQWMIMGRNNGHGSGEFCTKSHNYNVDRLGIGDDYIRDMGAPTIARKIDFPVKATCRDAHG